MITATAYLTATCDRIRALASDLDITIRLYAPTHPALQDMVVVESRRLDYLRLERVLAYGSYEFGCSWQDYRPAGPVLDRIRRSVSRDVLVPRSDLAELLGCFERATEAAAAGRTERTIGYLEWLAVFVLALSLGLVAARTGHYNLAWFGVLAGVLGTAQTTAASRDLTIVRRVASGRSPS